MQTEPPVVVVPGLDGWAAPREAFVSALRGQDLEAEICELDPAEAMRHEPLRRLVEHRLQARERPSVLVAESYAGPPAIELSARRPELVDALVLVSTFAVSPVPRWLAGAVRSWLVRSTPPGWLLRRLLVGSEVSDATVEQAKQALRRLHPDVAAARIRQAIEVDVRPWLPQLRARTLFLRGRQDRMLRFGIGPLIEQDGIEQRIIDGPHALLTARPEASAEAVAAFVNRELGVWGGERDARIEPFDAVPFDVTRLWR